MRPPPPCSSANYIATRLKDHYPVLYTGEGGLVAHECILDLRPLREETGVTVDDVAKRLIDYGFHAPTMSFPVAGTLMVEPTESEDLAEIERFIEAMIAIRAEAHAVAAGEWPADDNPLVNAPHTAESVVSGEWDAPVLARARGLPRAHARAHEVLAAGAPDRPGLRRPQPGLRLPADRGVRLTGFRISARPDWRLETVANSPSVSRCLCSLTVEAVGASEEPAARACASSSSEDSGRPLAQSRGDKDPAQTGVAWHDVGPAPVREPVHDAIGMLSLPAASPRRWRRHGFAMRAVVLLATVRLADDLRIRPSTCRSDRSAAVGAEFLLQLGLSETEPLDRRPADRLQRPCSAAGSPRWSDHRAWRRPRLLARALVMATSCLDRQRRSRRAEPASTTASPSARCRERAMSTAVSGTEVTSWIRRPRVIDLASARRRCGSATPTS